MVLPRLAHRAWGACALLALHGTPACKTRNDVSAPDSGSNLTAEQAGKVLAKVGDRVITLGEFEAALQHMDQFDRMRYQSLERRKELLEEMIRVELLAQEAVAKGYDKDPVTEQAVRAILRDAMLAEARRGALTPNEIPEPEVRAYYEAHRADYRDPERRRLSLLITKDEASAKDALEQAKKAQTAVQWGELVRAKSVDPQAKANVPVDLVGDVGFVSPPGDPRGDNARVPEEVRALAFEAKGVGEVAPRFAKSGSKFYIVRLTQRTEPHERTLAEAERSIRVKLAQDRIRAKEDELLAELRKQYPVQLDDAVLATVRIEPGDAGSSGDAGAR